VDDERALAIASSSSSSSSRQGRRAPQQQQVEQGEPAPRIITAVLPSITDSCSCPYVYM
jgi:hypothetical protein